MASSQAVQWNNGVCLVLDQTRLPSEVIYRPIENYRELVKSIQRLEVRGAPAIGIAGAYAVVLALKEALAKEGSDSQRNFMKTALQEIGKARPTAVNLSWAIQRMEALLASLPRLEAAGFDRLLGEAKHIHEEDTANNRRMAEFGADLLPERCEVITYCNTGDLATGGIGTAFGVIHEGFRQGKVTQVYACETRPVLQGARLTVWELHQNEIPYKLICDNMAGLTLRTGKVGAVLVGADRIARNGDAANKVGTYSLAVLAHYHKVPFYVVAPSSSFDLTLSSGNEIPIEQRSPEEILKILGSNQPPFNVPVYNPSFDVTPHALISGIVCERGIFSPPYGDLSQLFDKGGVA